MGLAMWGYAIAVGADLNGPVLGGIFAVIGFGAFGKHPRNVWSVLVGIILAAVVFGHELSAPGVILAALFGTTLAPLAWVRERCGEQMVLWGNIEASDLVNLSAEKFRAKVQTALHDGSAGNGRGFVLMPSACPYGRKLSARALENYELMMKVAEAW